MSFPAYEIKNLPTFDLDSLDFQEINAHPETYYEATLHECDGVVDLSAIWMIDWNREDCRASLAVGTLQGRSEWADSTSTQDWPVLDHMFGGRAAWQEFLAEKQAEAQEQVAQDEDEDGYDD